MPALVLLLRTAAKTGLTDALSQALGPGGNRCPITIQVESSSTTPRHWHSVVTASPTSPSSGLGAPPEVFGPVASDPTVSRLTVTLSADADTALAAIEGARAATRN